MTQEMYHPPPHRFCPWCAHPLPRDEPFRQKCPSCGFVLYHHSNPCVGALPLDARDRVLLGRRGIEPFFGRWNVIGGFLQYGEDPWNGLRREVHEELGVDCRVGDYVLSVADTYGPGGVALLCLYFRVRLFDGTCSPQDDVSELRWFPLDALPDRIAFESDRKALRALQSMVKARPTGEEP